MKKKCAEYNDFCHDARGALTCLGSVLRRLEKVVKKMKEEKDVSEDIALSLDCYMEIANASLSRASSSIEKSMGLWKEELGIREKLN